MRLFPEPLGIEPFEGFAKDKDIFNRKLFGEGLQRLFERVDDPLTVILDSPWGTGKSTFIEMWCGHMRQQGFPIIHIDAFKHDHADDAFGTLAGEVFAKVEEYCTAIKDQEKGVLLLSDEQREGLKDKTKKLFNVTRRFGTVVLKSGARGVAKRLAEKAVGEEGAEELKEHFGEFSAELIKASADNAGEELGAVLEELVDSKFAGRSQQVLLIEEFTGKLSELALELQKSAAELAAANGFDLNSRTEKRPLIFVIDELDRCKPNFSLEVLELVKHFFAQKGIHFLLSTHVEQLESSVAHAYGIKGQTSEYLQKFYSLIVKLPSVADYRASSEYVMQQLKQISQELPCEAQVALLRTAEYLFRKCTQNFSLRAIERAMAQLRLILLTIDYSYVQDFSATLLSLVFIKINDDKVYTRLIARKQVEFSLSSFWGISSRVSSGYVGLGVYEQWNAFLGSAFGGRYSQEVVDMFIVQLQHSLEFVGEIRYDKLYDEQESLEDAS